MHGINMVISGSAVLFVFKVSVMTPAVLIGVQCQTSATYPQCNRTEQQYSPRPAAHFIM